VLTRRLVFPLACLLVWVSLPATADVIYQYTGNPFTTVSAPYTTNDFVSVSLTLAEPLSPGFDGSPPILKLVMSDGVQTLTSSSNTGDCPLTMCLRLLADGVGGIIGWSIYLATQSENASSSISTASGLPVILFADKASFYTLGVASGGGSNSDSPGTWTMTVVPEPSTAMLSALGLLMVGAVESMRRSPE